MKQTDQIDHMDQPGFPYNPLEGVRPASSVLLTERNRAIVLHVGRGFGIRKVIRTRLASN